MAAKIYILQKFRFKTVSRAFFPDDYHTSLQSPVLNVASVAPISKVRASIMLITMTKKCELGGGGL